MIERFKNGVKLFLTSIRFFLKYPISIFPLVLCWCIYAPIILYFKYYFNWDLFSITESLGIVFLIYFVFSFIIGTSCLILLEMAEQIESKGHINLIKALKDCFFRDFIKSFPVLIIWSVLWFVLAVLEVVFRKRNSSEDSQEDEFTAKSAAQTLAGIESGFSLTSAYFRALQKGVRMVVFLILPAVAWEDHRPVNAIKKGFNVLKNTIPEFISGFALTELFSTIMFLPTFIIFILDAKFDVHFPDYVWYFVLVYIAFSWSLSFLVEQLYVAELYLWHINWEKERQNAILIGKKLPKLKRTKKPSFFDDITSLKV